MVATTTVNGGFWQGYTAATKDEKARELFLRRFGRRPLEVFRTGGAVLAGPLTRLEVESKKNGGSHA